MIKAKNWVHDLTREIQSGEKFDGKVTRLMDFGAFVELVPGVEGMVHISQFRDEHVEKINDVVKVGDVIPVVVIEIDDMGRINLSHKAAVSGGSASSKSSNERPDRPHNSGPNTDQAGPFNGPRPPR
jgi:polyribonucleotide nucleotidyltransferase